MTIKSPCINICKINTPQGYCVGCKRKIEEIINWKNMSDKKKNLILNLLKKR